MKNSIRLVPIIIVLLFACKSTKNKPIQATTQSPITDTVARIAVEPITEIKIIPQLEAESILIGSQVWTTKNLEVSHFRNGDAIPQAPNVKAFLDSGVKQKPAWCYYDGDINHGKFYGKLYNWYAVNDQRGLAPTGWHIPSDEEWTQLTTELGGENAAGIKLKSTEGWRNNKNGDNSSGFNGLPSGYVVFNGPLRKQSEYGGWWSSTEQPTYFAWFRTMNYTGNSMQKESNYKVLGLSVRCIKD